MTDQFLIESLEGAQRCQRNWDLSKSIPKETLALLKETLMRAPTKQNEEYYSVAFITDRAIIEKIYDASVFANTLFDENSDLNKNSQILANLLVAFIKKVPSNQINEPYNYEGEALLSTVQQSIGIVSGQLVLVANLLGLKTGFCACVDKIKAGEILGLENIELFVGIGYPDINKNRRHHHKVEKLYDSYEKKLKIYMFDENEKYEIDKQISNKNYFHIKFISPTSEINLKDKFESFFHQINNLGNDIEKEVQALCIKNNIDPNGRIEYSDKIITLNFSYHEVTDLVVFKEKFKNLESIKKLLNLLEINYWTFEF